MIDTESETLVKLIDAKIPGRPHVSTRWRWALHGVRGQRLESVVVGGVRYTSHEAVRRFLQRLNQPGAVPEPPNRAAERASAELAARGA